jgi:hypothetical protein
VNFSLRWKSRFAGLRPASLRRRAEMTALLPSTMLADKDLSKPAQYSGLGPLAFLFRQDQSNQDLSLAEA